MSNQRWLALWCAWGCLLSVCAASSWALTPEQEAQIPVAESYLKRVETNLELALSTAGPGDGVPTGSKAKLARLRLDEGAAYLPLAKETLAKLPADDAAVKPLQARYDAAAASAQKLRDRLDGKNAPPAGAKPAEPAKDGTPAAAPAPPASGGGTKLGYQQEEQLKGAQFNLREVEGNAAGLAELMAKLKPVEDRKSIDHREVVRAMTTIENANRKAGFVDDALSPLPADGAGVADTRARLDAARASVAASAAFFTPLHAELMKLIDPATYPAIDADIKRLRELAQMFGDPVLMQSDPVAAAGVLTQKDAALEEAKRVATAYAPLMVQQTELGEEVEGAGNYFLQRYQAYLAAAEAMKETLPAEIRGHLTDAKALADQAVAKQNVMFFAGGIPQQLGFAEDRLVLLRAIDPALAQPVATELETGKQEIDQRAKALETKIIQENTVPENRYRGDDREALTEVAVSGWKVQQPDAEVLAVYFPVEQWKRTTQWEYWNGTWTYVDYSKIQAQLLVKHDDELAVIRPVNLRKDHQQSDHTIGIPLDSIDDTLIPQRYLLLSKIE